MYNEENQNNEIYFNLFENSYFNPNPQFNEEINQQLNDYQNQKSQKNNQQTTCDVEYEKDQDFKSLSKITNEYKLKCEKVYAYQKPVPKQIPSVIEEIQKEFYNKNEYILDQTQKEEAFIKKCCKVNKNLSSVLIKKQLNQQLTQEELKQFNVFVDFLKKNQHSLKFQDQRWSEQDIYDILEQFQAKLNEAIKKTSSPTMKKNSKNKEKLNKKVSK